MLNGIDRLFPPIIGWECAVLVLSAMIAAIPVGRAWSRARASCQSGPIIDGPPGWIADGSWATNLTTVGTLVNLTAAADILPETPRLFTLGQYTTLILYFGALLIAAPSIYIFKNTSWSAQGEAIKGSLLSFLVANWITLSGVYGQLSVGVLLVLELGAADYVSIFGMFPLIIGVILLAVLLLNYSENKLLSAIRQPAPELGPADALPIRPRARWALL